MIYLGYSSTNSFLKRTLIEVQLTTLVVETNISLPDDSQFLNNKSGIVHTCRHIHLYNNVGEAQHTQVMPTSLIK